MCERLKLNGLIEPTYRSDCVRFSELVDGSIKAGHSNDERPICKIYEKSRRTPYRPRELHTSRRQGGEEVSQVETIVRGHINQVEPQVEPGFRIWKMASPHLELSSRPMQRRNVVDSEPAYETYGVFF